MKKFIVGLILLLSVAAAAQQSPPLQFPPAGIDGVLGSSGAVATSSLLHGLRAYYKMDEAAGNRLNTLPGFTLTDINATGSAPGKIGNAASFTSPDFLQDTTAATLLDGASGWSVSFWVNAASWSALTNYMMAKTDVSYVPTEFFVFYHGTQQDLFFWVAGGAGDLNDFAEVKVEGPLNISTWYHVVAWYSPNEKKPHLRVSGLGQDSAYDGFPDPSGALDGEIVVGAQTLGIGGDVGNSYAGLIDEVAIYNRQLSSREMDCLFGGGTPPAHPFSGVCN